MKRLAIIAVSLMTAFTAITPAEAFPVSAAPVTAIQNSDVVKVQYSEYRHHGRRNGDRRNYYRGRDHDRRYDRGYRRHNNTGAIIGGLAAGAIIGGIVAGSRSNGSSHAQSCANRYRTYRASDNTYQPNNGPRVQCR
ncbi:BA14K family protein [Rhizobium tumorigenes]|uniref:BA14K family protein n=1 Tax=Rhizobium tumorigenes TaxID=2041385 RepID=UPI00241E3FDB|nr:BA14K family protein [Rhizobium tumorigenes]WFS00170.1 BA14K family protein [Rhizobium tumorigenes]